MNEQHSWGSNFTAVLMLLAILLLIGGGGATLYVYRMQQAEQIRLELEYAKRAGMRALELQRAEVEERQRELDGKLQEIYESGSGTVLTRELNDLHPTPSAEPEEQSSSKPQ